MNEAQIASVAELQSIDFQTINREISRFGDILPSKSWEYPWLWIKALSHLSERDRVLDIGSGRSPMPLFMCLTTGCRMAMTDIDDALLHHFNQARGQSDRISFTFSNDERLPFMDESFDFVTSFSVIEHQKDKNKAINEAVRVLIPGGFLCISFDIVEDGWAYPRPEEKPFSIASFTEIVWNHPAFGNKEPPKFDLGRIDPFLAWHKSTNPIHSYIVGAAALKKIT